MITVPSIATEGYPAVRPPATVDATNAQNESDEAIFEPLVFTWDEDEFIAAEAVRAFSAEMYADSRAS